MLIERMIVGNLQTNCYLVACSDTGKAIIIDPGAEGAMLLSKLQQHQWQLQAIINTHGHADHIGADRFLQEATGAPVYIHAADRELLNNQDMSLAAYFEDEFGSPDDVKILQDGERLAIGRFILQVVHTPGHTPGGICLVNEEVVFSGDTLFAAGMGRTDFPGGSHRALITSIKEKLFCLAPETKVYPGHGPTATIGQAKRYLNI